ncbi:unnamed protein product [Oppiella nova]|uniref:Cytochrome P450 n=1 Tax=Oppiella nova TaxID=334625 RepID=A0A7R9M8I3_9ACAR|nr:unnamed protein product [Oppiella nova]CAG2172784.1 unnamed protein product [Oppiella nova]
MMDLSYSAVSWLITISVGLITGYLVRFYLRVLSLPRGPFPLPIIGNILIFRNTKVNQFVTVTELHETYGPVYTLWFGTTPMIIGDYDYGPVLVSLRRVAHSAVRKLAASEKLSHLVDDVVNESADNDHQ